MLSPKSAWKKITEKMTFSSRSKKKVNENLNTICGNASSNMMIEDFEDEDDDVFEVDENNFSKTFHEDFDFRTRSSFRALMQKTYNFGSYSR